MATTRAGSCKEGNPEEEGEGPKSKWQRGQNKGQHGRGKWGSGNSWGQSQSWDSWTDDRQDGALKAEIPALRENI